MFHTGQKVVCINDADQNLRAGDVPVSRGQVYVVRECFQHWDGLGIRLEEIHNPHDRHYHAERFQPAVERKTNISIFTAMLDPTRNPERMS